MKDEGAISRRIREKSWARQWKTHTAVQWQGQTCSAPRGLPQTNILPLFVWEKWPLSLRGLHLPQELDAHAVLRIRPHHSTLVKKEPNQAPTLITTSSTCSAPELPGFTKRVIDQTQGQQIPNKLGPKVTEQDFYLLEEWLVVVKDSLTSWPLTDAVAIEGVTVGGGLF